MTNILQISDPHLMSDRQAVLKGVPTAESLMTVLQEARDRCSDPACIVWTGDLSHEETVDGYQVLRELAGDWLEKSQLIPGNHDSRAALRTVFPEVHSKRKELICFCTEVDGWRLIGLDTHVPGEVPGVLSDEQLDLLQHWIATNTQQPTLIFMHHPPIAVGCTWLDRIALRNPDALETLVSRSSSVRGIFCGHVHHVYEGNFAGVPVFTAPSTAFQFDANEPEVTFDLIPPGFRLITLNENDFTTEVIRQRKIDYLPCTE